MKKYIVLDINHGGDILASILKNRGYSVIAYDIYNTRKDKKNKLLEKDIKVITSVDRDYRDYTIAHPIHCPDHFNSFISNNPKLTHHELVKLLFEENYPKNNIIEITGSKGKTTTSFIVAYLLSFDEDTYLNSSRGFEKLGKGEPKLIDYKNSISPGYTAEVLSKVNENPCVLEESLGVCGVGGISILTSTSPIYEIKGGNGNSLEAKEQLFRLSEGMIIIDAKDKRASNLADIHGKDVLRIWEDIYIEVEDNLEIGKDYNSVIVTGDRELSVTFKGDYLFAGYTNPILFGVLTQKLLNKDLDKTAEYLSRFKGVEKRISVNKDDGFTKITDISSGFSEDSLRYLLQLLKEKYDISYNNVNLLIDVNSKSHCQKTNIEKIDEVVGEFNFIDNAFLSGDFDFERFKYLGDSEELNMKKGDLLIECGKG